jgi:hypothetical protein
MSYPMRAFPLREDDINKPNIPPIAGPEIDDLEPADSGIDDGLLPPNRPDGRPGSRPGSRRGSRPPSHTPMFPENPEEPGHTPVCFAAINPNIVFCCIFRRKSVDSHNLVKLCVSSVRS